MKIVIIKAAIIAVIAALKILLLVLYGAKQVLEKLNFFRACPYAHIIYDIPHFVKPPPHIYLLVGNTFYT